MPCKPKKTHNMFHKSSQKLLKMLSDIHKTPQDLPQTLRDLPDQFKTSSLLLLLLFNPLIQEILQKPTNFNVLHPPARSVTTLAGASGLEIASRKTIKNTMLFCLFHFFYFVQVLLGILKKLKQHCFCNVFGRWAGALLNLLFFLCFFSPPPNTTKTKVSATF